MLIAGAGGWVRYRIDQATRKELATHRQTVLDANVAALRFWFQEQQFDAKSFAADMRVQEAVAQLVALAQPSVTAPTLANAAPTRTLQLHLQPLLEAQGYTDFVVVSRDFGLVKALNEDLQLDATFSDTAVGTPRDMSPEAIEKPDSVDGRSDLYSLGAVGYYLLTGQPVSASDTLGDLLLKQVHARPLSPSTRLGRAVAEDLEVLILHCLAKDRGERPPNARTLDEALGRCAAAASWTPTETERWWQTHGTRLEPPPVGLVAEKTLVIAPRG